MENFAHSSLSGENIHVPYVWEYADQAAREAASGLVETDEGKLARQLDDNSLWMLTDYSVPTWVPVGGLVSIVYAAEVTLSTQTCSSGAQAISFDTEVRDDGGFWDSGSPTRLTAPLAGWYIITGTVHWDSNTGNGRRLKIREGGSTMIAYASMIANSAHNDPFLSVSIVHYMSEDAYVELIADHNDSGESIAVKDCRFSIVRL